MRITNDTLLWKLVYLLILGIALIWIAKGLATDPNWLSIYSSHYISILSWVTRIVGSMAIALVFYFLPHSISSNPKNDKY